MKIHRVFFERDNEKRVIELKDNINLIYSKENSRGKTTLLRLILYGLGYNIPATDGLRKFDNFNIEIQFENCNGQNCLIQRKSSIINLYYDDMEQTFILPEQIDELHALIFNIDDVVILDNLLGTFYIDQEKGWTFLNRGIVIGKNRFNIESFIAVLSGKDIAKINNELKRTENELEKYRHLRAISEYKKDNMIEKVTSNTKKTDEELYSKINLLNVKRIELKEEIKKIQDIINDNKKLIEYLDKLDICIKLSDGNIVKVDKDNILNYNENQSFYNAKKREYKVNLSKLENEIEEIENEIDNRNLLYDMKTVGDEIDEMLQEVDINDKQLDKIINQLSRKRKKIIDELHATISNQNVYLNSMYKTIKKYASELKIEKYIGDDASYVLTDKLKGLTGRILTHMSFSFKLAYITEIKRKYNICLPIIIDSPKSNELTDSSTEAMIDIILKDFKEHQIIIASVYDFKKIDKNIIEMKDNLFY